MKEKSESRTVLIVTSDEEVSKSIGHNLMLAGYRVLEARSQERAVPMLEKEQVPIVLLDIETTAEHELDFVNYIKTHAAQTEVIVLAPIAKLEEATLALRNGASFYLIKPVSFSDIKLVLDKAAVRIEQHTEHIELEQQVLSDLMAGSAHMQKILKLATKIAPTNSTVLIGGESGTGKEFFAKIIHRTSQRYNGNFVAINCGAIPDTLFESEVFGHKKGSFTGADRDTPGLVEEANMGTLFLDEVSELSQPAQVKLLRFIQERTFRRVGESNMRSIDVRFISATNKNLIKLVNEGKFREDLFYRLNVFYLFLPPLRDRRETIPNLVRLFVHKHNNLLNKRVSKISKGAELSLATYNYPGNVRELENIIEHAMVLVQGNEIQESDLPEFMHRQQLLLTAAGQTPELIEDNVRPAAIIPLEQVEKEHIQRALAVHNYNFSETAKKLGVSRSTLWRKIRQYKLGAEGTPEKGEGSENATNGHA